MELINLQTNPQDSFIGYAESRVGGRNENQDSFSFSHTEIGFLVTVCDGMGGGPCGKIASNIAVTEIINGVVDNANSKNSRIDIIKEAIIRANTSIIEATKNHPELKGMGTTVVVLLINEESAIIAHVGDSRVYQLRGRHKIFRTSDHSVVFDMVRQGIITEEQARLSSQSNIITRALGVKDVIDVDICEVPYESDDRFLLSTDGIHGCMPEKELLKLATDSTKPLGPVVDNIATTADDIGRINGGEHDNLTIVIVQTKTDSKLKSTMSRKTKRTILCLVVLCIISLLFNIIQCIGSNKTKNINTRTLIKEYPVTLAQPESSNRQDGSAKTSTDTSNADSTKTDTTKVRQQKN